MEQVELKRTLSTHLKQISLLEVYQFENVGKELIDENMLKYFAYKKYKTYDERLQFLNDCRKQAQQKFKTEPFLEIREISPSVIETYRTYMAQFPNYKAT